LGEVGDTEHSGGDEGRDEVTFNHVFLLIPVFLLLRFVGAVSTTLAVPAISYVSHICHN
jgi:hypothetical protein